MENLMTKYKHLKNVDPTAIVDTPDADFYFSTTTFSKISRLKEIERSKIILEIQPHVVPTCICGNDCSVNGKGFRLLERKFGNKVSILKLCFTYFNWCYTSIMYHWKNKPSWCRGIVWKFKIIAKTFCKIPKRWEILTTSLNSLEMHDVPSLNWDSTRVAVFLDACLQGLDIIVPFLDTIIGWNITPEEISYIASSKDN